MKTFYTILASLVAGLVCVQSVSAVEFYKGRPESEKKEKKAGTDRYLVTLKVVDEDGDPISGAVIMIKGSSSGTVTGVDGKGFLMCVLGTDVLEVSQIGYRTESMHGAGSPQAQRIMIARQGNLEEKKQMAKEIIGVQLNGR